MRFLFPKTKGAKTAAGESKDLDMMTDGDLKSASPLPRMNSYGTEAAWLWESTNRMGIHAKPGRKFDPYAQQAGLAPGAKQFMTEDCDSPEAARSPFSSKSPKSPGSPGKVRTKSHFSGVVDASDEIDDAGRRKSIHLLL